MTRQTSSDPAEISLPLPGDSGHRSRFLRVRPGVLAWLESVRDASGPWGRWKYHSAMIAPWALQASGIAIRLLKNYDALPPEGDPRRAEAIAGFQACQDPADRLFKDPYDTSERYLGHHTWEQVWGQRHGATLEALANLGGKPTLPLPEAQFVDLRKTDGRGWTLDHPGWANPWGFGESWSRAIKAYFASRGADPRDYRNHPSVLGAFEALESTILDPATGTPSRRMPQPNPSVAMAGMFKVIVGYLCVGRPFPLAKEGIDSTLALQHADGEWGFRRNMCIVWDSLWVLKQLNTQLGGGHRFDDIRAAGRRTADMLLRDYLKPDGGFAFHGEHCQTEHHSIRLCHQRRPIGDMLGTSMCLESLRYADEWDGLLPVRPDRQLI